jgi:hypothetical protein
MLTKFFTGLPSIALSGLVVLTQMFPANGMAAAAEDAVAQASTLHRPIMTALEDLMVGNGAKGLLELRQLDEKLKRLMASIDNVLIERQVMGDQSMGTLGARKQTQILIQDIDNGISGGLPQLTATMRQVGSSLIIVSQMVSSPAEETLLRTLGGLVKANADTYEALGELDGPLFSSALLQIAVIMEHLGQNDLQDGMERGFSSARLETTHLPLIRALMATLQRTEVAGRFDALMVSAMTDDLARFGGPEGLAHMLASRSAGSLPGPSAFESYRQGVSHLGDLFGYVAGIEERGAEAIQHFLQFHPDQPGVTFEAVIRKIPRLETTSRQDVALMVQGLLIPGAFSTALDKVMPFPTNNDTLMPITQIALVGGLLGGGSGDDGLLSSLPLIGPLLEILLSLLSGLPLVGDLIDGLLGDLL